MTTAVDDQGNTIRKAGKVTEIVTPGPALQAEFDAMNAAEAALIVRRNANKARLEVLAAQARTFAKGSGTLTTAQLSAAMRDIAEMLARLHYDINFDENGS